MFHLKMAIDLSVGRKINSTYLYGHPDTMGLAFLRCTT